MIKAYSNKGKMLQTYREKIGNFQNSNPKDNNGIKENKEAVLSAKAWACWAHNDG